MEEAGDIAQAAAMSILILAINVCVRVVYEIVVRFVKKRAGGRGEVFG
jgi:iron(III) transport system permease protein